MVDQFVAPKFELSPRRVAEIPFSGTIAAGAHLTLHSGIITYDFRIIKVKMIFIDEADNLVTHEWYLGRGLDSPATGAPSGLNIFGRESPRASFRGRAIIREVPCNIENFERNERIKLYTYNGTNYAYEINCSVTIEEIG